MMWPPPEALASSEPQVRALAREIVARPEYAKYLGFDAELWRKLFELVLSWLRLLPELYLQSPALYWSILVALVLVTLGLIAHLVWSMSSAMRGLAAPETSGWPVRAEADFAGRAARLAADGEYLEASHQLLLASLAHAARARLFVLRPDDGNRRVCELLRKARIAPALQERLIALIERTQALWFGDRTESVELYETWRAVYQELRRSPT
jgi:hypothetical protein